MEIGDVGRTLGLCSIFSFLDSCKTTTTKIEQVDGIQRLGLGDGPYWDPKEQVLYVADLARGDIVRWSSLTNTAIYQNVGDHASFIIPIKGKKGEFVVGSNLDLLHIVWDINKNQLVERTILVSLNEGPNNKINDAKCDVRGRLWFGTWNAKTLGVTDGSFYSFTMRGGLVKHESDIFVSNGLGFSPDNKKMYYIDSFKYRVDQYSVDVLRGTRKFEKTVIDFKKADISGFPDGMTVDFNGKIWVACTNGSQVIHVDPETGKVLQKILFPKGTRITSATFGGLELDVLYATSGDLKSFPEFGVTAGTPDDGAIYKVTGLSDKGLPPFEFDMNL